MSHRKTDAHLSPRLVTQPIQKRFEKAAKLVFPIRRSANHERHGIHVSGLIGPGDRKSIQPMAEQLALGEYDQLHHFISAGVWDATPVETELLVQADRLVGGSDAVLVIDDTAIVKKGTHSVCVAAQYAS